MSENTKQNEEASTTQVLDEAMGKSQSRKETDSETPTKSDDK